MQKYTVDSTTRFRVVTLFQEISQAVAGSLDLDFHERVLMMEIVAFRLRNQGHKGTNPSALARATEAPYETTRRRVRALIDRGVIKDTPAGLDVADWEGLMQAYDAIISLFMEKASPLIAEIERQQHN